VCACIHLVILFSMVEVYMTIDVKQICKQMKFVNCVSYCNWVVVVNKRCWCWQSIKWRQLSTNMVVKVQEDLQQRCLPFLVRMLKISAFYYNRCWRDIFVINEKHTNYNVLSWRLVGGKVDYLRQFTGYLLVLKHRHNEQTFSLRFTLCVNIRK
jgi:hypothetical protein